MKTSRLPTDVLWAGPRLPAGKHAPPRSTALVPACRALYGAALLAAPKPILTAVTGVVPSVRARRVARVLGARHLAQAAISADARQQTLAVGAIADCLHAASMLILAASGGQMRRAQLADAAIASVLAAAGFSSRPAARR
jgi:hypothetical protein